MARRKNMLKETINSQSFTQGLANHFGTKASIKNMLSGKKNMRAIQPLFEDTKYAEEILEYGNIREVLNEILDDVFKEYIKVFNKKLPEGELGNTKDRVQIFIGLFDERLNKEPEGGIISSFADFAKSATGKKIAKVLKDSGNESNEDLMDVIAYVAIRSVIINADKIPEPSKKSDDVPVLEEVQESEPAEVVVEVIPPESHPHMKADVAVDAEIVEEAKADNPPDTSEDKSAGKKSNDIIDPKVEYARIMENLTNYPDDEIKRVVNMVFHELASEKFEGKINSYPSNSKTSNLADEIEYMLPMNRKTCIGSINISSFIRFILDVSNLNVRNVFEITSDKLITATYMAFSSLDILLKDPSPQSFAVGYTLIMKRLIIAGNDPSEFKKLPQLIESVNSRLEERRNTSIFSNMGPSGLMIHIMRDSAKDMLKRAYAEYGIL